MSPFPRRHLRQLLRVVNGGTPTADPENWDGEVPWATPIDLAPVNGKLLTETTRTLTTRGLATGSSEIPPNSLIVSTRAPIGYVAQVARSTAFNQGCRGLVPKETLDIRYIRYQLLSAAPTLQNLGQGSTFLELSSDSLSEFPLYVPPVASQRTIADYLDAETARIDALIEKKRRMAELLRDRLLHVAYQLTTDAPLRLPLRRVVHQVKTGTTPPVLDCDRLRDETVPWYSPGDVGEWMSLNEPARYLSREAIYEGTVPSFPANSTLVVGIGATAGRIAHLHQDGTGNQQMTCLVTGPNMLSRFLAWQLFARTEELRSTAPFTTLPILNNDFLKSISLSVPSIAEQTKRIVQLDDLARRTGTLSAKLSSQISSLQERRQSLITAAVSGELPIPGIAA